MSLGVLRAALGGGSANDGKDGKGSISQVPEDPKIKDTYYQKWLAYKPKSKKNEFTVNIGYCYQGRDCSCGYEWGAMSDSQRKCQVTETCRKMTTNSEEYSCRGAGDLKESDVSVCRSVAGCGCDTRAGVTYTCAFGQYCLPTATGNECWDINDEMKFKCPDLPDKKFNGCTCTALAKAKRGNTCSLSKNGVNTADNHVDWHPFSCDASVQFVVREESSPDYNNPHKWATTKDATFTQAEWDWIILNLNGFKTDKAKWDKISEKFDLLISSNHEWDRFGMIRNSKGSDGLANKDLVGEGAFTHLFKEFEKNNPRRLQETPSHPIV